MIPRNLPALWKAALSAGWDVHVSRGYYRSVRSMEADFYRGDDNVLIIWDISAESPRHAASYLNYTLTPYAQCAALIRNPEGA